MSIAQLDDHRRPHNLKHLQRDKGYRFQDRDPDLEWICTIIQRSGLDIGSVIDKVLDASGVSISHGCIQRWLDGTTKRPQNITLTLVANALGYERKWRVR